MPRRGIFWLLTYPYLRTETPARNGEVERQVSEGERQMTHYSPEEWIDFVTGVNQAPVRQEMQKHLDSGCERCKELVAVWRRVQSSDALDAKFEPPADAIRV